MYLIILLFSVVNYCRACVPTFIAATGPTVTTATSAFTVSPIITTTTTTVIPVCAPTGCSTIDLVDFSTTLTGPTTDASTCITTVIVTCNPGFTMVRIRSGATIVFVGSPATIRCNEATGEWSYDFTPGTFTDINSAFCM